MPDQPQAPITAENVAETRRLAEDVTNLNHMVPDARDTRMVPEAIVEAMNAAGDRLGWSDWASTTDERVRVMSAWCDLLPTVGLVPRDHDPAQADWHWAGIRCFLAGAGYEAHAALATQLAAVYPQCPLRVEETYDEWMEELKTAHQSSGIPACIAALPWSAYKAMPPVDRDALPDMGTRWMTGAALLHILKHTRTYADEVRVLYRCGAYYFRRAMDTNAVAAQPRLFANLMQTLGMSRMDGRAKEHRLMDVGATRAFRGLTFSGIPVAAPLTQVPGSIIAGQFTQLLPEPGTDGWFQHGMRLTNAWSAGNGRTRPFSGTDDAVMGYAWRMEALTDDERNAFDLLVRAVPATYEVDSPFAIMCQYQPNFVLDWCSDPDAYASILDSVLIMSVMRDRVIGARREFPLLWVLPNTPTPEESTNQGKTTAVGALAGCMTPGILVSRPPDSNSAPDMRTVASMLRVNGTVALDEWAMPKTQSHPLSSRNLQTLATGGVVPMGEVMENNPTPLMLRQPIVASAKCLHIPEDVRNRSIFLFQRVLTQDEMQQVKTHESMVSGEVAIRMRLAALSLVDQLKLHEIEPVASEAMRFKFHVALAARLYALRSGKTGPEAVTAITTAAREMESHFHHQYAQADESGLMSEMESGENLALRASSVFGTITTAELVKMRDTLHMRDDGRVTAGQLLRARTTSSDEAKTLRALLTEVLGYTPRANDRALAQAFARDLKRLMPKPGDTWPLPDLNGLDGWRLTRVNDVAGGVLRVRLTCINPASPHFTAPGEP